MFENINFYPGKIIYNDIDFKLNENLENIDLAYLDEDLLNVLYPNNYEIDLGWYGLKDDGTFCIIVHYSLDNCEPIYKKKFREPKDIEKYVLEAVNLIKKINLNKN